ncbi:CAAX prenyl protease-related protein [Methylocystis echinoides]|nr:CAAX prenyl protease-related protein [Methylocystis echinoides]
MTEIIKRTDKTGRQPGHVTQRLLFFGVVVLQIALLRYVTALQYMPLRDSPALLDQIAALVPAAVKASLLTGMVALVVLLARADKHRRWSQFEYLPGASTLTLNVASFLTLAAIFLWTRQAGGGDTYWPALLMRATPAIWVGMLASWAGLVAPSRAWREAVARNYLILAPVFLISFISFHSLDAELAGRIGGALIGPTLFLSSRIYSLTGETLSVVGASPEGYPIFGSGDFFGQINPACSGYEGMVLSAVFLGLFFYLEPRKMTALQMAFVILLSCVAVFLLNALRLALLVYVGVHLSPEIAQEGFHTNFGLLGVVVVVVAAVISTRFVLTSEPTAEHVKNEPLPDVAIDVRVRMLLPLIYLIGASLLCGLFSGKFFWLYPLPIVAATAGLYQIRDHLRPLRLELTPTSVLLASATFLAWLQLVPAVPQDSETFQAALFSAPFPLIVLWLSFRVFGAALIVPFAEELAFRGAFTELAQAKLGVYCTESVAQAGAMLIVAVAFGLVHNDFVAGALAGLAFGVARWRRNELGDAIVCHGLTNLLLCFYVLLTGAWAYWL